MLSVLFSWFHYEYEKNSYFSFKKIYILSKNFLFHQKRMGPDVKLIRENKNFH